MARREAAGTSGWVQAERERTAHLNLGVTVSVGSVCIQLCTMGRQPSREGWTYTCMQGEGARQRGRVRQ